METEFKEKTYEKYFSHEVARLTNVTFSPDQCDEALLGFDDAFWLQLPWIMRHAPFVRRRRWSQMTGVEIRELEHIGEELGRRMPPFRFNLFVQYKRPVFLRTKGANEWKHWQCPYYRYSTTPHQQDILEKIEAKSNSRAATVYASPAFWKATELWTNVASETIIENSNIASVGRLRGHEHYSYSSAGFQGKGHSETTDIASPELTDVIVRGLEQEGLLFNLHIKRTAKLILEAVRNSDSGAPLFEQARSALGISELDDRSFVSALATIEVFSDAFGTSYMAMG